MPLPQSVGTRIQGFYYDYSCVEISLDGGIQPRIPDIKYSHKLDPGELRGTSARIQGRTRGQYGTNGSLSIYKEDYELLKPKLVAKGKGGYMLAVFDITVVYSLTGLPQNEDLLQGCRIVSEENSHSAGNEALLVHLELHILEIITNGMRAVDGGDPSALAGFIPGL